MKIELLTKDKDEFIIRIDRELADILSPNLALGGVKDEIRMHDYVTNAQAYYYSLTEFKKAIGVLLKLATK